MVKTALLVVDVQNDFLSGSLALRECPSKHDGEEVIPVINELSQLKDWDLIVFTQDWHPKEHISFITNAHKYKQHEQSQVMCKHAEVYDIVSFDVEDSKRDQIMWPPHCIQGSWGAEFHKDLKIPEGSVQVKKGSVVDVDSYSAFYDNGRLNETELRKILKSNDIERTFICGVATDICVKYTVFDSLDLGFETYLIEDACRGVNCENIELTLQKMKDDGVHCVGSDAVASILQGTKKSGGSFTTAL